MAVAAVRYVISKRMIPKHLFPIPNGALYCVCHKPTHSSVPGDYDCKAELAVPSDGRKLGCYPAFCGPAIYKHATLLVWTRFRLLEPKSVSTNGQPHSCHSGHEVPTGPASLHRPAPGPNWHWHSIVLLWTTIFLLARMPPVGAEDPSQPPMWECLPSIQAFAGSRPPPPHGVMLGGRSITVLLLQTCKLRFRGFVPHTGPLS